MTLSQVAAPQQDGVDGCSSICYLASFDCNDNEQTDVPACAVVCAQGKYEINRGALCCGEPNSESTNDSAAGVVAVGVVAAGVVAVGVVAAGVVAVGVVAADVADKQVWCNGTQSGTKLHGIAVGVVGAVGGVAVVGLSAVRGVADNC